MAVASLVLGILWFGGVGAVLAIIFGAVARRSIRESNGTESGEGLATAGLILGIIGVVATVLFWVIIIAVGALVTTAAHQIQGALRPTTVRVGQPVDVAALGVTGSARVTVQHVSYPLARAGSATAPAGTKFAVARIRICTGASGFKGDFGATFSLRLGDGTSAASLAEGKQPNVAGDLGSTELLPGRCVTGYSTFEVPNGTRPNAVRLTVFLRTYDWTLSAPSSDPSGSSPLSATVHW